MNDFIKKGDFKQPAKERSLSEVNPKECSCIAIFPANPFWKIVYLCTNFSIEPFI